MTARQRTLILAALEFLVLELRVSSPDAAAYLHGRLDEEGGGRLANELNALIDTIRSMPEAR